MARAHALGPSGVGFVRPVWGRLARLYLGPARLVADPTLRDAPLAAPAGQYISAYDLVRYFPTLRPVPLYCLLF